MAFQLTKYGKEKVAAAPRNRVIFPGAGELLLAQLPERPDILSKIAKTNPKTLWVEKASAPIKQAASAPVQEPKKEKPANKEEEKKK